MDIWSPSHQRRSGKSQSVPKVLASVAVGIPVGLLSGVVITFAILLAVTVLNLHSYLYFLAVPVEIGLGIVLLPKNKVFAVSSTVTAICVSIFLTIICRTLDGPPYFTY